MIESRLRDGREERIVLVLLDAFGSTFLERVGHRLPTRGRLTPLRTQFPSTTTAHITTMHTGLPVGEHGLYEWHVYEPALDAVVRPLPFLFAGRAEPLPITPAQLIPGPTLYERLAETGVSCTVFHPAAFSPSTYDSGAVRGADLRPYGDLRAAVADALRAVAAHERAYAYVYYDRIDFAGHLAGPGSPAFADAAREALDAIEEAIVDAGGAGTTLMLTADHGQVDVDPAATLWLDELWPPLSGLLSLPPAGSSRDVFLHVEPEQVDAAVDALRDAVGDDAQVLPVAEMLDRGLFGERIGPRLLDRLASVCVLPRPGRMAWLRSAADLQVRFRGHHGGLSEDETSTYLLEVAL